MGNALHYEQKVHLKTVMECYSNDVYEQVPFTLDAETAKLPDLEISNRIFGAVYARFPNKNGYGVSMPEFTRLTPTTGFVVLRHYCGIGD